MCVTSLLISTVRHGRWPRLFHVRIINRQWQGMKPINETKHRGEPDWRFSFLLLVDEKPGKNTTGSPRPCFSSARPSRFFYTWCMILQEFSRNFPLKSYNRLNSIEIFRLLAGFSGSNHGFPERPPPHWVSFELFWNIRPPLHFNRLKIINRCCLMSPRPYAIYCAPTPFFLFQWLWNFSRLTLIGLRVCVGSQ